jgi:hypothetical protein
MSVRHLGATTFVIAEPGYVLHRVNGMGRMSLQLSDYFAARP